MWRREEDEVEGGFIGRVHHALVGGTVLLIVMTEAQEQRGMVQRWKS